MKIRAADLSEAEELVALHAQAVSRMPPGPYTQSQIDAWVAHQGVRGMKTAIGAAHVIVCLDAENRLVGYGCRAGSAIHGLFVHPDHQGAGIGTALLDHMEKDARNDSIRELCFPVVVSALAFYTNHGYKEAGREEWHVPRAEAMKAIRVRKQIP